MTYNIIFIYKVKMKFVNLKMEQAGAFVKGYF